MTRLRYSALAIALLATVAWLGPLLLIDAEPSPPPRSTTIEPAGKSAMLREHEVDRLRVRVVATYDHDPASYTQGLLWRDGRVFESTGQYGYSTLRSWGLDSGDLGQRAELPKHLFGEGLAWVDNRLVQLTWQEGVARIYRPSDLALTGELRYEGEGWGLCFDGQHLVMSDGTHVLTFREPSNLAIVRRLEVTRHGTPLDRLNELEWVDGWIYANIYQTDEIVQIDPRTGAVHTTIDASGLLSNQQRRSADVLNGIAYRQETETFLLTGKLWPKLFEVVFE